MHRTPLFVCLAVFAGVLLTYQIQAADKPNMIFILADDQGFGDMSHTGGKAATPYMDQLAKEGMRFTDGHTTSSVCTPTRYSILTGRYNWRSRLKKSVLFGLHGPLIPTDRTTVAGFLRDQGYHTGIVGKWHLGLGWQKLPNGEKRLPKDTSIQSSSQDPKNRKKKKGKRIGEGWDIDYTKPVTGGPNKLGFDESFIIPASLDMYPYVYLRDDKPIHEATVVKAFHRPGPAAADFEADQCLIDFARESRAFIKKNKDKPFFLYLPLTSPHTPIVPSKNWQGKSELGKYGDFMMETDWVVGEVLKELDAQNIAENTLVLFTADNGCSPAAKIPDLQAKGHFPNAPWRGHKADIFEGGHRVPYIIRWPKVVKAGTESRQLVSTVDFFATAAEMAGALDKIKPEEAEDSFSILPILKGEDKPVRDSLIHHSIAGSFAIRRGKWKLSLCPGSGGWSNPRPNVALKDDKLPPVQLYDLEADPKESNNLQGENPEVIESLIKDFVKIVADGRSTPGPKQSNEGWPDTTPAKVKDAYPALKKPE